MYFPYVNGNGVLQYGWGSYYGLSKSITRDTFYNLTMNYFNDRKIYCNAELLTTMQRDISNIGLTAYLFACNNNGSPVMNMNNFKIASCKLTKGEELVRDLIPCLDSNDIPCMYDMVSKETFYNAGTGQFSYGNIIDDELPSGYTRVKYLESTGTNKINTGISSKQGVNHRVHLVTQGYQQNGASSVIGYTTSKGALFGIYYSKWGLGSERVDVSSTEKVNVELYFNRPLNEPPSAKAIINGNVIENADTTTNKNTYSFGLFGLVVSNSYNARVKIWECEIYDNDTNELVFKYIPCLDDNGVPCVFDSVSGKTIYKTGTDEFLYEI